MQILYSVIKLSLNKKLICIIVISAIALSAVIAIKTLKPDNDTDFKRGILVKRQAEPAPTSRTISDIHPIPRTKSDANLNTIKGDFYEYYIQTKTI